MKKNSARKISTAQVAEKMKELKLRRKAVQDRDDTQEKADRLERAESALGRGTGVSKFAASIKLPKKK